MKNTEGERNFFVDDEFYLVYCYECERENYIFEVTKGHCVWCGWLYENAKEEGID